MQQKLGFEPVSVTPNVPVPLLHEVRTGHENRMTHAQWEQLNAK